MTRLLILISFWAVPFGAGAQNYDSLFRVFEQMPVSRESVDWAAKAVNPYRTSNPEFTEKMATVALQRSRELGYPRGIVKSYNLLGISYWARDNYEQAMHFYLESLKANSLEDDKRTEAVLSLNIGTLYDELKQFDKAREYTVKGLNTFIALGDSLRMYQAYLNLGVIYNSYEKYDSALYCFEKVLRYRQSVGDSAGIALTYNNIASVQENIGQPAKSIDNYLKALELTDSSNLHLLNDILTGLGHDYLLTGQTRKGISYLDSAIRLSVHTERMHLRQVAYSYLKDHYTSTGQYSLALEYLQKEYQLDRELRGQEVQKEIEVLNLKYQHAEKERALALMENETLKQKQRQKLTVTIASALLILTVTLFNLFRLKTKKDKELLSSKHELALLRENKLKNELEEKKRELAAYTINFVQKSEIFSDLKESIGKMKSALPDSFARELMQLNRKVEESFRLDRDWEDFRIRFEQVHQNFFTSLKTLHANLTSNELKLCALLKLNFNLKEAAQIMGVAPESVKTARYRLKKKLGLRQEENLVDFILMLEYPTPGNAG